MITVVIWCNVIHHHYSQAGLFSTVLETISSTGLGFRLDLYSNGSVGLRVDYTRWVGKKASATSDAEWRPSVSPYFGIPALCGSSTLTFTSYPSMPSLWSTVPQHTFFISYKPHKAYRANFVIPVSHHAASCHSRNVYIQPMVNNRWNACWLNTRLGDLSGKVTKTWIGLTTPSLAATILLARLSQEKHWQCNNIPGECAQAAQGANCNL